MTLLKIFYGFSARTHQEASKIDVLAIGMVSMLLSWLLLGGEGLRVLSEWL
jgi:hypothetical protein